MALSSTILSAGRRSARLTAANALSLQQHSFFSMNRSMEIIESVAGFHAARKQLPSNATVGLVPTMGVRKP